MSFIIICPVSKIIKKGKLSGLLLYKVTIGCYKPALYFKAVDSKYTLWNKNCIFNKSIMISITLFEIPYRVADKLVNK